MKKFFYSYNRYFKIFVFLLFSFFGVYLAAVPFLPKTVELILKVAVGPTFESKKITFPKSGVIEVDGLEMFYKKEEIIKAPKVEILYSKESLLDFRLEEIIVHEPVVNIVLTDVSHVNIVEAFSGGGGKKPGTAVPIDKITAVNGIVNYTDLSYHTPVKETVNNANGYVSFHKVKGIDLDFSGNNGEQKFSYSFSNYEKDYSMTIKLDNINLTTPYLQYAYDSEELSNAAGKVNLDLTIASDGLTGTADFKDGQVRYSDLDELITNINGNVKFLGDKIIVKADFDALGKKNNIFDVYYSKESGVDVKILLKDVEFSQAEKYKLLKEAGLPLEGLVANNVQISLVYNEKKEFIASVDFDAKKYNFISVPFENISGKLVYQNDELTIKDLKALMIVENDNIKAENQIDMELLLKLKESEGVLKYNVKEKAGKIPNVNGELDFSFKNNFIFDNKSNIFNLSGEYNKEKKELALTFLPKNGKALQVKYDFGENKILKVEGSGKYKLEGYSLETTIKGNEELINVDTLKIAKENFSIEIAGVINPNTLQYDFKFNLVDIGYKLPVNKQEFSFKGNFQGEISGIKDKFKLKTQIRDLDLDYYGKFEKIYGEVIVDNQNDLRVDFNGELGRAEYEKYSLEGIRYNGVFYQDNLKINYLNNDLISLKGDYNLKKEELDFDFAFTRIDNQKLNLENFKFILEDVTGKIKGKIDNPEATVDLKSTKIYFSENQEIAINGIIDYKNKILSTKNLNIGSNSLKGKYNLIENRYNLDLNISEKNIFKYSGNRKIRGEATGKITLAGRGSKITSQGDLSVKEVYFSGKRLPNLLAKAEYNADNFTDGVLKIEELSARNLENQRLLYMNGSIALQEEEVNIKIPSQNLELAKIKDFLNNLPLEGSLNLSGEATGKIQDVSYGFKINSGQASIEKMLFNGIRLDLNGNFNEMNIKDFKLYYLNNPLQGKGKINFTNEEYSLSLKSQNVVLGLLNLILKKYDVENVEGTSEVDINLSSKGNTGYLKIQNFGLTSKEYLLNLKNTNALIDLDGDIIKIDNFNGSLNNGKIALKGYLEIPKGLREIQENLEEKKLDYELQLKLDQIEYSYEKYFQIFLSSDLFLKGEKLRGSIIVDRGQIRDIPQLQLNLLKIVFDYLFNQDNNKQIRRELGRSFEVKSKYESKAEADVIFMIKDGIKVDIPYANSFVEDIKGNIYGQGKFTGKEGNLLFLGDLEVKNGSLTLNGTNFALERAAVIFDKKNDYFPSINPTIFLDARSTGWNNPINLSLSGNLKDLQLSSKNRWGEEDNSIFGGGGQSSAEASAFLMKGLIDSQVSSIFLKPVSELVKGVFGIQKFKISSNVVTYDEGQEDEKGSNYLGFGAYLEAEDAIYKDKIFWVAKANLISQNQSDSTTKDGGNSGSIDEYDFSIIYKIKPGFSTGIGVQKVPESFVRGTREKSRTNLNYHIDFIFEKRYDSLVNIFNRK